MSNLDKFNAVADSYSQRFDFDPYYALLIALLEEFGSQACTVLEVGAANGMVPEKWDRIRTKHLSYCSVEPVARMVDVAREKARGLRFIEYSPLGGTLATAPEQCPFDDLDLLLMSRSMHEIYLGYERREVKLSEDLSWLIQERPPKTIVYGDPEKYEGLTPEETDEFVRRQSELIGHGHDPARDFLSFLEVEGFLEGAGYNLVQRHTIAQPLPGFTKPAWNYSLGVFQASSSKQSNK